MGNTEVLGCIIRTRSNSRRHRTRLLDSHQLHRLWNHW